MFCTVCFLGLPFFSLNAILIYHFFSLFCDTRHGSPMVLPQVNLLDNASPNNPSSLDIPSTAEQLGCVVFIKIEVSRMQCNSCNHKIPLGTIRLIESHTHTHTRGLQIMQAAGQQVTDVALVLVNHNDKIIPQENLDMLGRTIKCPLEERRGESSDKERLLQVFLLPYLMLFYLQVPKPLYKQRKKLYVNEKNIKCHFRPQNLHLKKSK